MLCEGLLNRNSLTLGGENSYINYRSKLYWGKINRYKERNICDLKNDIISKCVLSSSVMLRCYCTSTK